MKPDIKIGDVVILLCPGGDQSLFTRNREDFIGSPAAVTAVHPNRYGDMASRLYGSDFGGEWIDTKSLNDNGDTLGKRILWPTKYVRKIDF